MKNSILQQMAAFGLATEFRYGGEARFDGNYRRSNVSSSVHSWLVRVSSRRREGVVMEDEYAATVMEHTTFKNDATILADKYLRSLISRIDRVHRLGTNRTFTGWCRLMGVAPADLKGVSQEFWRDRFNQDCRVTREFGELLGEKDLDRFLSTTIR